MVRARAGAGEGASGTASTRVDACDFVDDATFVTKAGDVGVVYRPQGQDYEGLDHAYRRHVVHRFEAALRLLGERSRVYQYFFKRQAPPIAAAACASPVIDHAVRARAAHLNARAGEPFEMDLFLVLMYEGLAEEAGIAIEPTLPHAITNHSHALVFSVEPSSRDERDTNRPAVVGGHCLSRDELTLAVHGKIGFPRRGSC
jgi:hypothetical protein